MTVLPQTALARIGQLAAQRPVHEAFRWLHLQQRRILEWQAGMVAIAAPPFGEGPRAQWVLDRFRELNLDDAHIDDCGNVLGLIRAAGASQGSAPGRPCVLLSAHIDTVFPAGTPLNPVLDETLLQAPGACDNGAGVSGLLALAAALRHAAIELPCDLLLAANVGEEGDGDLRGIRHLYRHSPYRERIAANLVLDGAGHEVVVTQALGSRRFLATIRGPGGHSWSDAGTPNPILALAQVVSEIGALCIPVEPRTSINVGTMEGGTSVNVIPEQASARFDFRSTDTAQLDRLEAELRRSLAESIQRGSARHGASNAAAAGLNASLEKIGDRPAATLPADAAILELLCAVDRHLGIATGTRVGSTDANIPMSLGIEAISMGAGGSGGGMHTRAEWYDAAHRVLGLKRILLLTLALLDQAARTCPVARAAVTLRP